MKESHFRYCPQMYVCRCVLNSSYTYGYLNAIVLNVSYFKQRDGILLCQCFVHLVALVSVALQERKYWRPWPREWNPIWVTSLNPASTYLMKGDLKHCQAPVLYTGTAGRGRGTKHRPTPSALCRSGLRSGHFVRPKQPFWFRMKRIYLEKQC